MVDTIKFGVQSQAFQTRLKTGLKRELSKHLDDVIHTMRKLAVRKQPVSQSRARAVLKMRKVIRGTKFNVRISDGLLASDELKTGHYVPVKFGSPIRRWAVKNNITQGNIRRVSGRSRLFYTAKNRIAYSKGRKSAFFVEPRPFFDESVNLNKSKLQDRINSAVRYAFGIDKIR